MTPILVRALLKQTGRGLVCTQFCRDRAASGMLDLKNVAIVETGVRDGLGDRLTGFDRGAGQTLQILRVRPELAAFGATLDEVVARFTERSDRHVLNARGVVRDGVKARPLVVFEHIEGERFDDILARAHALSVIPDITVALFLANHLLTALAALARTTQAAHGALGLNRILVTPRGRLVITEHVFGPLLEQLEFSHTRLWRELRVAMPEEPVPALCDYRADVAQVAVITLSLILGRPLEDQEYPDRLEDLLGEVREVAWIRAGDGLANAVGSWLDLALPLPGRLIFDEASQAKEALGSMLPSDRNFVGSRADLHAFLKQIAEAEASDDSELTTGTSSPPPFEVVSASGETILVAPADGQDAELDDSDDAGGDLLDVEGQAAGEGDAELVVEADEPGQDEEDEPVIELSADLLDELKTFGIVLPSAQALEAPPEPAPAAKAPTAADAEAAPAAALTTADGESPAIERGESPAIERATSALEEPPAEAPPEVAAALSVEAIAVETIDTADQTAERDAPAAEATALTLRPEIPVGGEAWFDLDMPVEAPIDEALPVAAAGGTSTSIGVWRAEPLQVSSGVVVDISDGWFDLDSPVEAPVGPPLPLVAELPVTEEPRFERDSAAEEAARERVNAEAQAATAAPTGTPQAEDVPVADAIVREALPTAIAEDGSAHIEEPVVTLAADASVEEAASVEGWLPAPPADVAGAEAIVVPAEVAPDVFEAHIEAPAAEGAPEPQLPAVEARAAHPEPEPLEPDFELFATANETHPHANLDAWFELEPPVPAPVEAPLFDAYAPPEAPAVPPSTDRLFPIDLSSETPPPEPLESMLAGPATSLGMNAADTPPAVDVVELDAQDIRVAPEAVVFDASEQPTEPRVEAPAVLESRAAEPEEAEHEPKTGSFASFLADVKALISKIKGPGAEDEEPVDSDRVEWEQGARDEAPGVEAAHIEEATEAGTPVAESVAELDSPAGPLSEPIAAISPIEEPTVEIVAEPERRPEPIWAVAPVEPPAVQTVVPPKSAPAPGPGSAPFEGIRSAAESVADVPGLEERPAPSLDDATTAVEEVVADVRPSRKPVPAPVDAGHDRLADVVAVLEEAAAAPSPSQPAPTIPRSSAPRMEPPAPPAREAAPANVEPTAAAPAVAAPKKEAAVQPEPAVDVAPEKKHSRRSRHRKRKKAGARPDAAPAALQASVPVVAPALRAAPPATAPPPAARTAAVAMTPPAVVPQPTARPAVPRPAPAPHRPVTEAPAAGSSLITDPEAALMRQWMVTGDETPSVPAPQPKSLSIEAPGTAPPPRQSLISDADVTIIRDWTAIEGDAQEAPTEPFRRPFGAQPPGGFTPRPLRPTAPSAPSSPAAVARAPVSTLPIRPDLSVEHAVATKARESSEEVALKARVRALIDSDLKVPEPEPVEPRLAVGGPTVDKPSRWTWRRIAAALVVLVGGAVAGGSQLLGPRVRPGIVIVESTPPASEVFLDGAPSGKTPLTLKMSPGEHGLELRYDGHRQVVTLSVASGDRLTQSVDWATSIPTGTLEVTSEPPGARVHVDGQAAGETPVTLDSLSLGEHKVTVENASGSVTSTVLITEEETTKLNVPIFSGWLAVFAPVELQIFERGRLLGTTTDSRILVRPGVHRIELKNEAFNYRALETVEVKPGEVKALSYEPKGRVNLNATPWAEVSVDGKPVGETPLANVLVTIGTREFVFRHPQLGERRVTAVVTAGQTKLVNVDMTRR